MLKFALQHWTAEAHLEYKTLLVEQFGEESYLWSHDIIIFILRSLAGYPWRTGLGNLP